MKRVAREMETPNVEYQRERRAYWNQVANDSRAPQTWSRYYHARLAEIYQFLVPRGQRVLELGCAQGDLLAALQPSLGVGIDFADEMICRATQRHPRLEFVCADVHCLNLTETFDYILLSDLVNDVWDVQTVFEQLKHVVHTRTRVIINTYSRLWELPLALVEQLHLAKPTLRQNWLTVQDLDGLLRLTNFETIQHWQEILYPMRTPLLDSLCNRFLVKLWPLTHLALSNFIVAHPLVESPRASQPSVSVIIPARNEAGNIESIFARTPPMGSHTELVFVEGHSRDDTYKVIEQAIEAHPERCCKLVHQSGKGKGNAVREGFAQARGEIVMILDADLTMPPEDLPRYYEALRQHKAEFVNGVRLVYPMEQQAMRFLNLVGNKFFGLAFSWLLGQSVKDTLCGTKALWRSDYELIAAHRSYFGDFDPFGDFDLLFGAARLKLKIIDLPIRYRERTYGTTNIQRWRHGWLLLRMMLFAALRLKFV